MFYAKDRQSCAFSSQLEKSYNRGFKPYRFKGAKEYEDDVGWYTLVNMRDVWSIDMVGRTSAERLGYATQKPEALLERIVKASSVKGGVVLDPFCGCGTAVAVAQRLKRRWIGIDITHLATNLIKRRLRDAFGKVDYGVIGEPETVQDAHALAQEDRFQFECWALSLVHARPHQKKKGADAGIDGKLYFRDEGPKKVKQIILSVKSGQVHVSYIRDLRGTIEREKAEMGALLTLEEPTKPMIAEAAAAGFYEPKGVGKFPKLQILTIAGLFAGKELKRPPEYLPDLTFKKAPKAKGEKRRDGLLEFDSQAE